MTKKKVYIFLILFFTLQVSSFASQTTEKKTILFLIPFYSEDVSNINISAISTEQDILEITSFQLISFWEGASIACKEFERNNVKLTIIVKDIVDDELKLKNILEDEALMRSVDLIIGPFFKPMFEIASQYALKYKIPIVNPFTTKTDILYDNPYVFKALPSLDSIALGLASTLMKDTANNKLFVYGDESDSKIYLDIKKQFPTAKFIKFQHDIYLLQSQLSKKYHNIVILESDNASSIINNLRLLHSNIEKFSNTTFIIPKWWMTLFEREFEAFNALKMCFFDYYYLDNTDEQLAYFNSEYIDNYGAPASIERFVYQGYDIAKFFIKLAINDFNFSKFNYNSICLDFKFAKQHNGGYENTALRLIQIEGYQLKEIK